MNEFDGLLKSTFRRREPPPGFADRVLSRLPSPAPRRSAPQHWPRLLALAASLVVVTVGSVEAYRYRQGQRAKQQLMLALEITAEKLDVARNKVTELNRRSLP
ncbi:MAG: hypothetical protein IT168_12190 [Bryobacterales bacterium]|nr:hypothetical protein [Bryobacterales bacterium]